MYDIRFLKKFSNKSWEFWLQAVVETSGSLSALPLRWDRESNLIALKHRPILWCLAYLSLALDSAYQCSLFLTLDFSRLTSEDIMKFIIHACSRSIVTVAILVIIPHNFAVDHVRDILTLHRKIKGSTLYVYPFPISKNYIYFSCYYPSICREIFWNWIYSLEYGQLLHAKLWVGHRSTFTWPSPPISNGKT
jgi:hypothetical protein